MVNSFWLSSLFWISSTSSLVSGPMRLIPLALVPAAQRAVAPPLRCAGMAKGLLAGL